MKRPALVSLAHIGRGDIELVGEKAANLGELLQAGMNVPHGFVVTQTAYHQFLKSQGLSATLRKLLKSFNPEHTKTLHAKAHAAQNLILTASFPEDLRRAVEHEYRALQQSGGLTVAVRASVVPSSATDNRYFGQHTTYLHVRGPEALLRAIQHVWASLFEPQALYYRALHKIDHLAIEIGVIVQTMVVAEAAGTVFTSLPDAASESDALLIEAIAGLGDPLVGGALAPDRYFLSKEPLAILDKVLTRQPWQLAQETSAGRVRLVHRSIPRAAQRRQKIADTEITSLAQHALSIEQHYYQAQKIDWAIDAQKAIWFLAAYPLEDLLLPIFDDHEENHAVSLTTALVSGFGASLGVASGPARIVHRLEDFAKIQPGDVVVTALNRAVEPALLQRAGAIVTDLGNMTSQVAALARELGIPCVVGTGHASHVISPGLVITVDGRTGRVHKGKVLAGALSEAQEMRQQGENAIATGVLGLTSDAKRASAVAKLPVNGMGPIRGELLLGQLGTHPQYLLAEHKEQTLVRHLSSTLRTFAEASGSRPIFYQAADITTQAYRRLTGGRKVEPQEENPTFGYRGAARILREPALFEIELQALRVLRESYGLRNISLVIPFVRTVDELEEISEFVARSGLRLEPDFRIWMNASVPANIMMLEDYLETGIDGIFLDIDHLSQFLLGIDRENPRMAQALDERHPVIRAALVHAIEVCRRYHLPVSAFGASLAGSPELLEAMIRVGLTSISVAPNEVAATRQLLASIERRIILDGLHESVFGNSYPLW